MNTKRLAKIEKANDVLKACLEEEQEFFDNHSEHWQEETEAGENSQEWIDALTEATDTLDSVL